MLAFPYILVIVAPFASSLPSQCDICRSTLDKFRAAFHSIGSDKSLGGGNTEWEEKHIGQYIYSELHSLETIELTYQSLNDKESRYLTDIEHVVVEFWSNNLRIGKSTIEDIESVICIDNLKHCCPWDHYGLDCVSCPICIENRGKCDGNGTRTGSGLCICTPGYTGTSCEKCDLTTHFQTKFYDENNSTCAPCNVACSGGCNDDTSLTCVKCADGFIATEVDGGKPCLDVNECSSDPSVCESGTYCVNTEGSYSCEKCPPECSTCHAVSQCITCAPGFFLNNGTCSDIDECSSPDVCSSANQRCVNKKGSYTCLCKQGYRLKQGRCTPIPSSITPRRTKPKDKAIWSVPNALEFAKFFGLLFLLGFILYLTSHSISINLSAGVLAAALVCYYCRTFDELFDKL